jgi:hypothetical protein
VFDISMCSTYKNACVQENEADACNALIDDHHCLSCKDWKIVCDNDNPELCGQISRKCRNINQGPDWTAGVYIGFGIICIIIGVMTFHRIWPYMKFVFGFGEQPGELDMQL